MKLIEECFVTILGIIDNNPSSMHREYSEFYAVHVYLRSIRISLLGTSLMAQGSNTCLGTHPSPKQETNLLIYLVILLCYGK